MSMFEESYRIAVVMIPLTKEQCEGAKDHFGVPGDIGNALKSIGIHNLHTVMVEPAEINKVHLSHPEFGIRLYTER